MSTAWLVASVLAATPAPGPVGNLDDNPAGGGTPGLAGFLFTFALALVVIGLALSLVRGMRRMERNSRLREASAAAGPVAEPDAPHQPPSQAPVPSAEPPDEVVQPPVPPAPPAG